MKKSYYVKIGLDFLLKVMKHLSAEKLVKRCIPYLELQITWTGNLLGSHVGSQTLFCYNTT